MTFPREVAEALQATLTDLIGLSLQAKQLHWNVTGPLFKPLHEAFDEFTAAYREWYDEVAERMLAVGSPADGRVAALAKGSRLEELPEGPIRDRQAVSLLLSRLEAVASRLRGRLDALGEQDPVSQDLAIGVLEGLEKQAWMLRAQAA